MITITDKIAIQIINDLREDRVNILINKFSNHFFDK